MWRKSQLPGFSTRRQGPKFLQQYRLVLLYSSWSGARCKIARATATLSIFARTPSTTSWKTGSTFIQSLASQICKFFSLKLVKNGLGIALGWEKGGLGGRGRVERPKDVLGHWTSERANSMQFTVRVEWRVTAGARISLLTLNKERSKHMRAEREKATQHREDAASKWIHRKNIATRNTSLIFPFYFYKNCDFSLSEGILKLAMIFRERLCQFANFWVCFKMQSFTWWISRKKLVIIEALSLIFVTEFRGFWGDNGRS